MDAREVPRRDGGIGPRAPTLVKADVARVCGLMGRAGRGTTACMPPRPLALGRARPLASTPPFELPAHHLVPQGVVEEIAWGLA